MRCGLTFRLGRTRRADVGSSDTETLSHIRSWAGYITGTLGSSFRKRQGKARWPTSGAANEIRAGHQSQDRQGTRPNGAGHAAGPRRRGDRVNRGSMTKVLYIEHDDDNLYM